jgi:cyclopropane-fatty-acyl-phospholipid synthase
LPTDFDPFIGNKIFPETNFPRLTEIIEASEYLFEVRSIENDRESYVRTSAIPAEQISQANNKFFS